MNALVQGRSSFRTLTQRMPTIPAGVQLAGWLVLGVTFASPKFLLLFVPVAVAMWLWKRQSRQFDIVAWLRHLLEMVVAMYVGMLAYHLLVASTLQVIGLGAVVDGDLGYVWMNVAMVIGMVTFMRLQGHDWRMASEMSLAMVVPMGLCFALVGLGICPLVPFLSWLSEANVYGVAHDSMLVGMVALMVVRLRMYGAPEATSDHCAPAVTA